jgi:hypothetical protein
MPFTCKFQLNNGAIKKTDVVIFIAFIESSFGTFFKENTKIAKILFNEEPAFISSNSPCFPSTKGKLVNGDQINEQTILGYFSADGEDIPYDRPYAIIEFE